MNVWRKYSATVSLWRRREIIISELFSLCKVLWSDWQLQCSALSVRFDFPTPSHFMMSPELNIREIKPAEQLIVEVICYHNDVRNLMYYFQWSPQPFNNWPVTKGATTWENISKYLIFTWFIGKSPLQWYKLQVFRSQAPDTPFIFRETGCSEWCWVGSEFTPQTTLYRLCYYYSEPLSSLSQGLP